VSSIDIDQPEIRSGIADYRFLKMLGAGNHGVFYLARKPPRLPVEVEYVAVKVLSGESSQDTFRRAVRELAAFAEVDPAGRAYRGRPRGPGGARAARGRYVA